MSTAPLDLLPLGTSALAPAGATPAPGARGPDTPGFRTLLESLEKLAAAHRQAPPVQDADQLQDAMARADSGFTTAMELRRLLEAAFRARTP
ncbi:MAG: hypothetical protein FJ265_09340 [Planctomycetes bacterium]|nr:hypothetical protein [Planctomycetota bacterium]